MHNNEVFGECVTENNEPHKWWRRRWVKIICICLIVLTIFAIVLSLVLKLVVLAPRKREITTIIVTPPELTTTKPLLTTTTQLTTKPLLTTTVQLLTTITTTQHPATSSALTSYATGYMFIHANSTVNPISYTMTSPISMVPLLTPTDPITALCNTVPGGNSVKSPANTDLDDCPPSSPVEGVTAILDGDLTSKYYNTGNGSDILEHATKGVGTGFYVVPQSGDFFSILQTFQFGTANDEPNRDPITITIEASQFYTDIDLEMGSSWILIYNGSTGINMTNDPGRCVYGSMQTIAHPSPYRAYRVLIAEQRGVAKGVQYSEVQFFGYFTN